MENKQTLIAQMVSDISNRLAALDADRRRMFVDWLQSHHQQTTRILEATLQDCLTKWFEGLPMQSTLWEYQLLLSEIAWWRDLEEGLLAQLMADC